MDYIVFDLEWNQSSRGKYGECPGIPFEIIEIGAIRLNRDLEEIGCFHRVVRPVIYPKLHSHTREVICLDEEVLRNGVSFREAALDFLSFCSGDVLFCTWGSTDLTELQRNLNYYDMLSLFPGPLHYYDVQKLFAVQYENRKECRSLEHAINALQLAKDLPFHQALSDARYTARIFRTIDPLLMQEWDSIDVYQNPKTKAEEIHASYDGFSIFISREFDTREEVVADKETLSTRCCQCGRKTRKKLRWFAAPSRHYYCIAYCPEHGYLRGKIRIRHTDDGKFFACKTIRFCGDEEMQEIRSKREHVRKKRKAAAKKGNVHGSPREQ